MTKIRDTTQDDTEIERTAKGDKAAALLVLEAMKWWIDTTMRKLHRKAWRWDKEDCRQLAVEAVLVACRHHRPGTGYGGLVWLCNWRIRRHADYHLRAEVHRPMVWLSMPSSITLQADDRDRKVTNSHDRSDARLSVEMLYKRGGVNSKETIDAAIELIKEGVEYGQLGGGFSEKLGEKMKLTHQGAKYRLRQIARLAK